MEPLSLRCFLSEPHQRALEGSGLLDREAQDPLLDERLQRIRAQVAAALALASMLMEMGYPMPNELDLLPMMRLARAEGILNRQVYGVLADLNREANEAKHQLRFRARL